MDSKENNVAVESVAHLKIGWAEANITPEQPVMILGQFYYRVSEGVHDPLTATILVLDSGDDHVIFVSCDLVAISNDLRDTVRRFVTEKTSTISPFKVVLNATHTHTGAEVTIPFLLPEISSDIREKLGAMTVDDYTQFAAERIAEAIIEAWDRRAPGGVAYGQGYAVIGRNRRWVDTDGQSTMYGLDSSVHDRFRHIEGVEDHSINVLAAYDRQEQLTGIVINLACPSQEGEHGFELSADWWHETREELRARYGRGLFILPQCSAAGELTSHLIYDHRAHERMLALKGRSARQEVACRIADAVDEVLPYVQKTIKNTLVLQHQVESISLMMNRLTPHDAAEAERDANDWNQKYEVERQKLFAQPERFKESRWYVNVTQAYQRSQWHANVVRRYKQQQHTNELPVEIHVVRLGDIVFATNPFEYYVDFGVQIKVRSPAIQTFLVQLAGEGTYVPSPRSVSGGGYGSVPASNVIGAEGGQQLAEYTVSAIRSLWGMNGNEKVGKTK